MKGKSSAPTYAANVDLLIGMNPIVSPLQVWANKDDKYLLEMTSHTFTVASGDSRVLSFTDTDFYCILGATVTISYSETFDDYGGSGPITYSGTAERALWNYATGGPNPSRPHAARHWPFCFYWMPGDGPEVIVPALELGVLSAYVASPSSIAIKVYYAKLIAGSGGSGSSGQNTKSSEKQSPIAHLNLSFEPRLGDGDEYTSYPTEQILYPPFAGVGTANMDLGSSASLPNIRMEILGSYPLYAEGDCDFADIIEDILAGGLAQPYYGSLEPIYKLQRGLGCFDYPAVVQAYQQYSPIANSATNKPRFQRGG